MTGHEGKEVTGSVQCCAVNKSDCRKASMTDHERKEVTSSMHYSTVSKSDCGRPA